MLDKELKGRAGRPRKINDIDLAVIRELPGGGEYTHAQIAAGFGVDRATVTHINLGYPPYDREV